MTLSGGGGSVPLLLLSTRLRQLISVIRPVGWVPHSFFLLTTIAVAFERYRLPQILKYDVVTCGDYKKNCQMASKFVAGWRLNFHSGRINLAV